MKVYMVIERWDGDSDVTKVFADEAKAEQFVEEVKVEYEAEWDIPYDGEDFCVYIQEIEVE